jgi:hypothetical protein
MHIRNRRAKFRALTKSDFREESSGTKAPGTYIPPDEQEAKAIAKYQEPNGPFGDLNAGGVWSKSADDNNMALWLI